MASGIFASDIGAPEGPVALPDGSMWVTEMSSSTLNVTHLSPTGARKVVRNTKGRPNGLAIDGNGMLWVAEAGLRALICIDPAGNEVKRLEGDEHDGHIEAADDRAKRSRRRVGDHVAKHEIEVGGL